MATSSPAPASTSMITLKYSGATLAALITVGSMLALINELFGLWTDRLGALAASAGGYVGVVELAVIASVFSVASLLLYKWVTKDVAAQPTYVNTTAYNFITNGFFAVLVLALSVSVAGLLSILLSSLLLIGTTVDIGTMYLAQFLPGLVSAAVLASVGYAAYKIMRGKNLSVLMTIVLVSLAGALLLATLITVPIKAHTTTSSAYDYNKYFQTYIDSRN